jgi:hypothetical protein
MDDAPEDWHEQWQQEQAYDEFVQQIGLNPEDVPYDLFATIEHHETDRFVVRKVLGRSITLAQEESPVFLKDLVCTRNETFTARIDGGRTVLDFGRSGLRLSPVREQNMLRAAADGVAGVMAIWLVLTLVGTLLAHFDGGEVPTWNPVWQLLTSVVCVLIFLTLLMWRPRRVILLDHAEAAAVFRYLLDTYGQSSSPLRSSRLSRPWQLWAAADLCLMRGGAQAAHRAGELLVEARHLADLDRPHMHPEDAAGN